MKNIVLETVFDHNLTEDEFRYFFKKKVKNGKRMILTKNEAMKWIQQRSKDENYAYIAELYSLRMDKEKMKYYIDRIKDSSLRQDTAHIVYHTYYEQLSEH